MGTQLIAQCSCGYEGRASIASGRIDHGKIFWFPHACNACHQVVSVDLLKPELTCNKCGSADVISYAASTRTEPYKKKKNRFLRLFQTEEVTDEVFHTSDDEVGNGFCYKLEKTFSILRGKHHCPSCNQTELMFGVELLYD